MEQFFHRLIELVVNNLPEAIVGTALSGLMALGGLLLRRLIRKPSDGPVVTIVGETKEPPGPTTGPGDPAVTFSAVSPLVPENFVGRVHESERATALLMQSKAVNLVGFGGMGKTTLAAKLARDLAGTPSFKEGLRWAVMGDANLPALCDGLGRALDIPNITTTPHIAEKKTRLSAALADREVLIVLDNARNLQAAQDFCSQVYSRTVVTSREPVPGLQQVHLDVLTSEEAQDLIRRSLPDSWSENQENTKLLPDLARLAQCHPLYLTLMVSTLQNVAAQVVHRTWMEKGSGEKKAGEESLRSAFESLALEDQRYCRLLGVFKENSFSLEAALSVFKAENYEPLNRLAARSFVQFDHQNGRYSLHPVVAEFVRKELDGSGDTREAVRSLADFYKGCFAAQPRYETVEKYYDALEKEFSGIADVITWCDEDYKTQREAKEARNVLDLYEGLRPVLDARGYWGGFLHLGHRALETSLLVNDEQTTKAVGRHLADIYDRRGEHARALDVLAKAGLLQEKEAEMAHSFQDADKAQQEGSLDEARAHFLYCLHLARTMEQKEMETRLLVRLGTLARTRGQIAEAEEWLDKADGLAKAIEHKAEANEVAHQLDELRAERQQLEQQASLRRSQAEDLAQKSLIPKKDLAA